MKYKLINLGIFDLLTLALLLVSQELCIASAEMTIRGTLYSITSDDYVINSQSHLYYLRKDSFPKEVRALLEKHPNGMLSLSVDIKNIDAMKVLPAQTARPLQPQITPGSH